MSETGETARFVREGVKLTVRDGERTRRKAMTIASWAFVLATIAAVPVVGLKLIVMLPVTLALLVAGYVASSLAVRSDDASATHVGSIEIDARRLRAQVGAETIECALPEVESAWIGAHGETFIRLGSGREIVMELGPEDGGELLRHLRMRPGERAVPIPYASASASFARAFGPLQSSIARAAIPFLIVLMSFGTGDGFQKYARNPELKHLIGSSVVALLLTAAMAGLQRLRKRRSIVVGSDGIAIHGAFTKRFLPWNAISGVSNGPEGGVVLELTDGARVDLGAAPGGEGIGKRIEEAREARATHEEGAGVEHIDRSGRTIDRWREDLLALAQPSEDYRRARIEPDRLSSLIADPASPSDRRLGAAFLLSKMGDPAREGVRIAIDSCADAPMKAALERAAAGELAEEEVAAAEESSQHARVAPGDGV